MSTSSELETTASPGSRSSSGLVMSLGLGHKLELELETVSSSQLVLYAQRRQSAPGSFVGTDI